MNSNACFLEDDELGYEISARKQSTPVGKRTTSTGTRNLSGRERCAHQSRYEHRSAPTSMSGVHCRRNKRHGI